MCDECGKGSAGLATDSDGLLFKDELIRQVTINCAERGILLLRCVCVCVHVCAW